MKGANINEIYEKKNCRNCGGSRYGSDEYGEWYQRHFCRCNRTDKLVRCESDNRCETAFG